MDSPNAPQSWSSSSVRPGVVRREPNDDDADSVKFMQRSSSEETMFLLASNPSLGDGGVGSSALLMDHFDMDEIEVEDDDDDFEEDSDSSLSTIDDSDDGGGSPRGDPRLKASTGKIDADSGTHQQQKSMRLRLVRLLSHRGRRNHSKHQQDGSGDRLKVPFDIVKYQAKRKMSVCQEKWNAVTILPNPFYCTYFLLTAQWVTVVSRQVKSSSLSTLLVDDNQQPTDGTAALDYEYDPTPLQGFLNRSFGASEDTGCLPPSPWHSMPALPPLPVLAVVAAICLHAPFSCLYHWCYSHCNGPNHWSRRLDQSFIHVASALMTYASSGSADYFLANALYNADCVRLQFRNPVRPRQNQARIAISILAYLLPIVKRGDLELFGRLFVLFAVSGWLFASYPLGGWSHAAFHLVVALVPPLLLAAATRLDSSSVQIRVAAQCAAAAS
jgi:hypothetical protein